MRVKHVLRSAVWTLIPAAAILLAGALLLAGVQALLPDYTGEYRVYPEITQNLLPVSEGSGELILYPWKEMSESMGIADVNPVEEALLSGLLAMLNVDFDSFDYGGGIFFCNEIYSLIGVRELEVVVWEETREAFRQETDGAVISSASSYLLSYAMRYRNEEWELCFCHLEKVGTEDAEGTQDRIQAERETGYAELCVQAKMLFEEDNPFYTFLIRYYEFGKFVLGLRDGEDDSVWEVMDQGTFSSFLYEKEGYFCYTDSRCNLTVLCDPIERRVVGFSLEKF